ncbi:hypothetical protein DIURU_003134 [Diutina rugosa]|uniref:Coatomer subunit alpha n=1 Tax=Diutina rugosa TaxID=5481 RepID=A0A642UM92_DIURU|nr:uncharacterized protein DIURU_003134 [Diutina rugosa]KAA8901606.1 hypothetical protein DIURU_003134 [Diutina rugosa]
MKMLTKFESKTSRAKGVAFHPKRPWALVSLHSSTIQLWDYRMGTLIDRFDDHTGPVRCVDFHPTQPLFVSGGDDYTVKVWSLNTRKCIFTLNAHLDYVRTVFFHKTLPWIISCSDDLTIKIWNWQNRQEIACLTGHNHYVMSAQFHPTEDLIVSASLDQTVRVWDISGLRKKHSAPGGGMGPGSGPRSFEDQLTRSQLPQQDIFGNANAVVKYVLEGHDKGVNWAAFHPTLPLIVSAADDRLVKLWRMSDTKAWEVDTCRGHTGNVLCSIFHPTQDLILSVSDDKTVRVWDLNKRTPIKQFRREHDRFWLIANHPSINLFAACHDSGVMIFKLERERPAHAIFQNKLFYVNGEKQVQAYDYARDEASLPMLSLKKIGKTWSFMRTLSYNQSDNSILVTHGEGESGQYALISLPKNVTGAIDPTDIRQGEGNYAWFISRNRFVVYYKSTRTLQVKDMTNNVTKSITLDSSVNEVLYGGPGRVLLVKSNAVINYDVQQRKELNEVAVNNVKYAVWSGDGQHLALLSKHTITIVTSQMELVTSLHETIRIKSAAWDDATGVLVYSTLNHIKYILLNGDSGIIKTLANTVYVTRVAGTKVYCLNRQGEVEVQTIDPTEYRFKKSLVSKQYGEVLRLIKHSNLVGQNIIGYLQKKGHPEVALQFVRDPETRFDLALECSNLDVAREEAEKLDKKTGGKSPQVWERLGQEALLQGNLEVVEEVYKKLHQLDKLSYLYSLRGDREHLGLMARVSENQGDLSALVQNTLYSGDIKKRCQVYIESGMLPLAYTLAQSHGLLELAQEILNQAGVDASEVQLPEISAPNQLPTPVASPVTNWPLKQQELTFFESALINGHVEDAPTETISTAKSAVVVDEDQFEDAEDAEEEDGWDLDDDLVNDEEFLKEASVDPAAGVSVQGANELAHWLRNAKTPATYVAAGEFEQAASLLNKQVGVTNFAPLKARFLEVYAANKLYLPGFDDLPPIPTFIRADNDEDDPNKFLPLVPGYAQLDAMVQQAVNSFHPERLPDAITKFRNIIYTITVLTVADEDQEAKCKDVLALCREYILASQIELERKALDAKNKPENVKRNLELAAYFTRTHLQQNHKNSAWLVAMTEMAKYKNYAMASYFADKILENAGKSGGKRVETAMKIKKIAEQMARDAVEIDFDPYADFEVCCGSHTPIYADEPRVHEALVGAVYKPEFKGEVCRITEITKIGVPASGLRIRG